MASVAFTNSTSCLCVELIKYLGDKSRDHGTNTSGPSIDILMTNSAYSTR